MAGVTMKDVAAAAGVSVASVSNAYNRPGKLSRPVRERILATGVELGYAGPSAAGRALRSGKANAVGIIYAEQLSYAFLDPYAVAVLAGISQVLEGSGTSINLLPMPDDSPPDPLVVKYAVADGFIGICAGDVHPGVVAAKERGLPVVLMVASTEGTDFVTIDELAAGRELAEHLAAFGHEDVVIIVDRNQHPVAGQPMWIDQDGPESLVAWYRSIGWVDAADRVRGLVAGLPGATVSFVTAGVNSRTNGAECARLIRRERPSTTAIVGLSDVMALAAMEVLRAEGVTPGREVSVAGFDGIDAARAAGLTTIGQPIVEKGRRAAELLLDQGRADRQILLDSELVVGTSTGPAPRRAGRRAVRLAGS